MQHPPCLLSRFHAAARCSAAAHRSASPINFTRSTSVALGAGVEGAEAEVAEAEEIVVIIRNLL
jgi:hypothetical protein